MQEGERLPGGQRAAGPGRSTPRALRHKKCCRPCVWAPREPKKGRWHPLGTGGRASPHFRVSLPPGMGARAPLLQLRCARPPAGSQPLGFACWVVSTSASCFSTAIVITEQPVSVSVPVGYSFALRCRAEGRTSLQYQWFCQHQVTVGAEVALSGAPGWVPAHGGGAGLLRAELVGTRRLEGEGDRMRVDAEGFGRCWGRGRAMEKLLLLHPCSWRRGGNQGFLLFLLLQGACWCRLLPAMRGDSLPTTRVFPLVCLPPDSWCHQARLAHHCTADPALHLQNQ